MQTSPENEPYCMRHSKHHAVHMPRRVSLKSFSETSPEKTRWPHELLWKSRDPSAVISLLKVTSDSLLWLARLPTLGIRSARTLILFVCLSHCSSMLLLPLQTLHCLSVAYRLLIRYCTLFIILTHFFFYTFILMCLTPPCVHVFSRYLCPALVISLSCWGFFHQLVK